MSYKVRLQSEWFTFKEFCKTVWRYWRKISFAKAHARLILSYLGDSPFHVSRDYLREQGAETLYTYGETPLTSLEEIFLTAEIKAGENFIEVGSGRGVAAAWAAHFWGCRVTAIELIPHFVKKAKPLETKKLTFQCASMLEVSYAQADAVYLCGSCLDDETITEFAEKLKELKKGRKVLTTSYPISDYAPENFTLQKHFKVPFTWGKTSIYLCTRV